jgi:hypothetical protein
MLLDASSRRSDPLCATGFLLVIMLRRGWHIAGSRCMNASPTTHSLLILLTIQIGKTQLMLRDMRRGREIDPEHLKASLEAIERLSWQMAEVVTACDRAK